MLDGEKNLIEQAISGKSSAFGELYDRYQPQIYRFIYFKVSHREEAEDLTHQVFLNAWQNIQKYKFQGYPFSSWLYSIARNKVIDYYRTKKTNLSIDQVAEIETNASNAITIDISIDIDRVKKAILELNETEQDIIIMRFVEDASPREIAKIINKNEGSVKVIQHRAIKKLKNILKINDQ